MSDTYTFACSNCLNPVYYERTNGGTRWQHPDATSVGCADAIEDAIERMRRGAVRPAVPESKSRGPHTHTKGDSYYDCPNDNCDIYDPQFANKLPDPLVCRHGYLHTSSAYVAVCNKLPNPHLDTQPDRCRCGAESHPGHACADPATIANRNPYPAESCAQCGASNGFAGGVTVSYDGHTHRYSNIGEALHKPKA